MEFFVLVLVYEILNNMVEKIIVLPENSLFVDDVSILGSGYQHQSNLTIQCTYFSDEERLYFQSYAHIICDNDGTFDLSKTFSVGGTYTGVQPMGLFWSMIICGKSYTLLRRVDITKPLIYEFKVFDGFCTHFEEKKWLCECNIKKFNMSTNTIRIPVQENNLYGTLFLPKGDGPYPGVILIYGGIQKEHVFEESAAHFANNGFAALVVAFYGVKGLPHRYTDQPLHLEYFGKAIDYLLSYKCVISKGVCVFGQSKAGDIALSMMSVYPKVIAVAVAPACVVIFGSAIMYQGKSLTSYFKKMKDLNWEKMVFQTDDTIILRDCMPEYLPSRDKFIPFHLSKANVLIIVPGDDKNCDAEMFANAAIEQMELAGKQNYETMFYKGLGHLIYIPNTPVGTRAGHPIFPREYYVAYGGEDKQAHHTAERDLWPKIMKCFRTSVEMFDPKSNL